MIILITLAIRHGEDHMEAQGKEGKIKFGVCSSNLDMVRDLAMDSRSQTMNLVFARESSEIRRAVQILLSDGCNHLYIDGSDMGIDEVLMCGTSSFLGQVEKVVLFNAGDRVYKLVERARATSWDCGHRVHILPDPVDAKALIEVHLPWGRGD